MKEVFCFDLDGTIADASKRLHFIEGNNRDWDSFFGGIKDDAEIKPVADLARRLETVSKIVAVTARPEKCRADTVKWCEDHGIYFSKIYMRPDGDYRPDNKVKPELIDQIISDGYKPVMFFDDRSRVVESIREKGYVCAQVAPGDFDVPFYYKKAEPDVKAVLTLLIGPVGAGKTTYRKQNFQDHEVVSPDDIRTAWYGDHKMWHHDHSKSEEYNAKCDFEQKRLWSYVYETVANRINHNLNTVVDATFLTKKSRDQMLNILPPDLKVVYVVINRPLEDKLATRGWRSEELVKSFDAKFHNVKRNLLSGDGRPNVEVINLVDG